MPRQDVAFLEDQLDEQASACWKQRKWNIFTDKKKKKKKKKKTTTTTTTTQERRGHRQGIAGSDEQQTGPFGRHHLGSAVVWGRLYPLTLHQNSQRVKLVELDRSCGSLGSRNDDLYTPSVIRIAFILYTS